MNGPCGQDKVPSYVTLPQGLVTPVESGHSQRPKADLNRNEAGLFSTFAAGYSEEVWSSGDRKDREVLGLKMRKAFLIPGCSLTAGCLGAECVPLCVCKNGLWELQSVCLGYEGAVAR